MAATKSNAIHTYMAFGLPLDPANVRTLVDLDLSYALSATLTEWSDSRELVAGLAKSWKITGKNEIQFQLKDGPKEIMETRLKVYLIKSLQFPLLESVQSYSN